MASFKTFPCCVCRQTENTSWDAIFANVCKTAQVQFKRLLEHILEKAIYHIDPKLRVFGFADDWMYTRNLTNRELNMRHSLIKLLKKYLDASKVDAAKSLNGIPFVLHRNLEKILENHNKISKDPFEILCGKASYQRLVVDCLLFSAKFTNACMKKFENEMWHVFEKVINVVEEFFTEKNIVGWIEHCIQLMDPFGAEDIESDEDDTDDIESEDDDTDTDNDDMDDDDIESYDNDDIERDEDESDDDDIERDDMDDDIERGEDDMDDDDTDDDDIESYDDDMESDDIESE